MITKAQMKNIKDYAIHLDWDLAFGGKSKGNRHLFRVVANAKKLCRGENAREDICIAGAWLHDSGLAKDLHGHPLCNEKEVRALLSSIGIEKDDIDKVIGCIASHDGKVLAKTNEARIVHDADTLDKTGMLGIIRETWKRSQMGWTTDQIASHLPKHLKKRESNLYTKEAKDMAKRLNKPLKSYFNALKMQMKE